MEKTILTSTFNRANRFVYIILLLVLIGFSIGCWYHYNHNDITTTFYLIGSVFFILLTLIILREIYNAPTIVIKSDKIELVRIFKIRTDLVELHNIESWANRSKKNKYGDYTILYIVLNDLKKLKIKSYHYSNFHQLAVKLTHHKPINEELQKELLLKEYRQSSFAFVFIGCIFIFFAARNYNYKNLSSKDISVVSGHLSQPLRIEKGRNSNSLLIKLKEFPEYDFRAGGMTLQETYYSDLMNDFREGDVIDLTIQNKVYDKKISKKKELTYWDLIYHFRKIHVVEIYGKDFKYLAMDDYNRVHQKNSRQIVVVFGFFGLLFIIGAILIYKKRNE